MSKKTRNIGLVALTAMAPLAAAAQSSGAGQPANTNATLGVSVVEPISITNSKSLEFGGFLSPTSNALVVVNPNPTSPVNPLTSVTFLNSFAPAARPAEFNVIGEPNAGFIISISPSTFLLSSSASGATPMQAFFLLSNPLTLPPPPGSTSQSGMGTLDPAGQKIIHVGANLNVGANQAPGTYQGQFDVSVQYQ